MMKLRNTFLFRVKGRNISIGVLFVLCLVCSLMVSCIPMTKVALCVESDSDWKVLVLEYDLKEGYVQHDVLYAGNGNRLIYFENDNPQYVYAYPLEGDTVLNFYYVLPDGTYKSAVHGRTSTGAIERWRSKEELDILTFEFE